MSEILPPHRRLDHAVNGRFLSMMPELDRYLDKNYSFVETDITVENLHVSMHIERLIGILHSPYAPEQVRAACYGAYYFAHRVGEYLMGQGNIPIADLLSGADAQTDEHASHILSSIDTYLTDNPSISQLIAAYQSEFGPIPVSSSVPKYIAALTFMQIEDEMREQYTSELLDYYEADLSFPNSQ